MSNTPATLLIADDDMQVRTQLESLLQEQGYRTLVASSGTEILAMVAQQPPDLILLDAMMAGMDGYAVARQLKASAWTANIPIIMLSGQGDQSARLLGLEAGAEDFLCKPVASDELGLRVRNLLRLKAFGDYQTDQGVLLEAQMRKRAVDLAPLRSAMAVSDDAIFLSIIRRQAAEQRQQPKAARGTFEASSADTPVEILARQEMENALRDAVHKQAFELYYQPKIRLNDGHICGLEALLRWHRPGLPTVPPAVFVPILERLGLISRVGQWVIDKVCRQIAEWHCSGLGLVEVAVNVSAQQIGDRDLIDDIRYSLKAHQVDAKWLEIELTESSLMENTPQTIACLLALQDIGIKISIDDFGTGYSSLAYLSRFPIDKLKIDIAFIREVTHNPQDAAIARTIIELAHSLNLQVIAEGVETRPQLDFLTENGCDQVQGFLFCRPLPVRELEPLLRTPRSFTSAPKL